MSEVLYSFEGGKKLILHAFSKKPFKLIASKFTIVKMFVSKGTYLVVKSENVVAS